MEIYLTYYQAENFTKSATEIVGIVNLVLHKSADASLLSNNPQNVNVNDKKFNSLCPVLNSFISGLLSCLHKTIILNMIHL